MKVLVVAAHPDDEVLGVGGAIVKHAKNDDEVNVCILGEGITSRYEKIDEDAKKELNILRKEALGAKEILGVKEYFFYNLPDNKFDSVPLLDIVKIVENCIDKLKPEIIYTHHYGDLNIDHRKTFEAVITAARPIGNFSVKKILCFEILSSTEWNAPYWKNMFAPNVFVDIKDTIDKKIKALKAYKKEIRKYPHPRSEKGVRILAQNRGLMVGLEYAEAFELVREVMKED